jgi:hypothetical protein
MAQKSAKKPEQAIFYNFGLLIPVPFLGVLKSLADHKTNPSIQF